VGFVWFVMVRVRYSFGSRHTGKLANIKKQRGKYPDVMKDVVRISDIVLEVLDARFVGETRNVEVEDDILKKDKKLVYVFNKCDLVDLKEFKKEIPSWMKPHVFVSATTGIGLKDIKARIKMESKRILKARSSDKGKDDKSVVKDLESKRRVHVGVIGYPNAGKSSVINFITRRGVAKVAKQAGFTKGMQKIRMSENILILDTPGVIPVSRYSTEVKSFAEDVKVGARSAGDVRDPEGAVFHLMKTEAGKIEKFYGVDVKGDAEVLIEEVGRKKKFLGRGGKVDIDRSARLILRDWQQGWMTKKVTR
jgi:ribosome biogenesis GTPase A